jgi:hypothetical protein
MNATLTADPSGGPPRVISLGDIGSGPLQDSNGNPLPFLLFASTQDFASASFAATLSPTDFVLSNGSTFVAAPTISEFLSPSSGSCLVAGVNNALITAPAGIGDFETGNLDPCPGCVGRSSAANGERITDPGESFSISADKSP